MDHTDHLSDMEIEVTFPDGAKLHGWGQMLELVGAQQHGVTEDGGINESGESVYLELREGEILRLDSEPVDLEPGRYLLCEGGLFRSVF